MIQEHLIAALKNTFPDKVFRYSSPPNPVATLPSPCATIGQLAISADSGEVTVYLGGATHGHFGCYDNQVSEAQKEAEIAADVITFLKALFADRVVVWHMSDGRAGGWRVLEPGEQFPRPSHLRKQFVWSRELA